MTSLTKTVTLLSSDGEEFVIPINVAEQSKLIKNMLDDVGESRKIPISNVNSATLANVMEYCTKHADVGATSAEELKDWDAQFFNRDKDKGPFDIMLAANYMDIKSLLDSSSQMVADMIKNKTVQEVREFFNIKSDFNPEEEEQHRRDYQWAFED